jgi:colicin import membrane protein
LKKIKKEDLDASRQVSEEENRRRRVSMDDADKLKELRKEEADLAQKIIGVRGKGDEKETNRLVLEWKKKGVEIAEQEKKINEQVKAQEKERQAAIKRAQDATREANDKNLGAQELLDQRVSEEIKAAEDYARAIEGSKEQAEKRLELDQAHMRTLEAQNHLIDLQNAKMDAQKHLEETKADLATAKQDFGLPGLRDLASGHTGGSALAKEAERYEKMAKRRLTTAPEEAARFAQHALDLRKKLAGKITSGDADPLKSMEQAVTKSEEHLKKIEESLKPKAVRGGK